MSITLWTRQDPFTEFEALVRKSFGPSAQAFTPAAEVVRDGEDAVVRLEVPGVDVENDVAVEVEGGRLVVSGERKDTREGRTPSEHRYGAFRRTFRLPKHVAADAVTATYDRGVLSVRVAGAHTAPERPEPRRIAIESNVDHTA